MTGQHRLKDIDWDWWMSPVSNCQELHPFLRSASGFTHHLRLFFHSSASFFFLLVLDFFCFLVGSCRRRRRPMGSGKNLMHLYQICENLYVSCLISNILIFVFYPGGKFDKLQDTQAIKDWGYKIQCRLQQHKNKKVLLIKKPLYLSNKAVYTATFVAGSLARAVMSWAGAVIIRIAV